MKKFITLLIVISLIIAFGCASNPRRKLSPQDALLGHWITENGGEEFYFSSDQITFTTKGENKGALEYRVILNQPPNGMAIQIGPPGIMGHRKVIAFKPDKMSLLAETQFNGMNSSYAPLYQQVWLFKDENQAP